MLERLKGFWERHKTFRKTIGILLVFIGFVALLTPLTPGSWLILIGFEILGFRILFLERLKTWFK